MLRLQSKVSLRLHVCVHMLHGSDVEGGYHIFVTAYYPVPRMRSKGLSNRVWCLSVYI